jgi:ABC-type transporter Mla subunit MlaD
MNMLKHGKFMLISKIVIIVLLVVFVFVLFKIGVFGDTFSNFFSTSVSDKVSFVPSTSGGSIK